MSDAIFASVLGFMLGLGSLGFGIALWLRWRKPWKPAQDALEQNYTILEGMVDVLEGRFSQHLDSNQCVTCEVCGCLVDKRDAVDGKDEVRVKCDASSFIAFLSSREKHIHTPHYCKRCAKEMAGAKHAKKSGGK